MGRVHRKTFEQDEERKNRWRMYPRLGCWRAWVTLLSSSSLSAQIDFMLYRDGTVVSGDSLGMVKFWDSQTCTQLQSFQGHSADVLCLSIGPVCGSIG